MKPDHILVRFGELTTKGKNRKLFIRKLLKNTKEILHDYSALEYELTYVSLVTAAPVKLNFEPFAVQPVP